jgi:hypothetical protein
LLALGLLPAQGAEAFEAAFERIEEHVAQGQPDLARQAAGALLDELPAGEPD